MALIACTVCQGTISNQAASCPHCGHPLQRSSSGPFRLFVVAALIAGTTFAAFALYDWLRIQKIEATAVQLNEDQYIGIPVNIEKTKQISISYEVKNGPNFDVFFVEKATFDNWNNLMDDVTMYRTLSHEQTSSGSLTSSMPAGSYYVVFDNTDRGTMPPVNLYNDQVTFDYQIKLK
jgi:hypothetical protein